MSLDGPAWQLLVQGDERAVGAEVLDAAIEIESGLVEGFFLKAIVAGVPHAEDAAVAIVALDDHHLTLMRVAHFVVRKKAT